MLGFSRYPVSLDVQDWISDSAIWAMEHGLLTTHTPLILPTSQFFSAPKLGGPEDGQRVVAALIDDFKRHLGCADDTIDCMPLDVLGAEYRYDPNALSGAAGTFQTDTVTSIIRYDPALLDQKLPLLSMIAHEMTHHILHKIPEPPFGDYEAEELSTDAQAIFMGCGVLQMAGAEVSGWQGYLSQPTRAHALALFLLIRHIEPTAALNALPPRSAKYLKRALKELSKQSEMIDRMHAALPDHQGTTAPVQS